MAKSTKKNKAKNEKDSAYILKLVLYLLLGSIWIKISNPSHLVAPIPIGLLIGLIFSSHEHFKIDRKIEYAVLLIAVLIGYWTPFGFFVKLR